MTYVALSVPVTGITVMPSTAALLPTDTIQLIANVIPTNANNQEIIWKSDNPEVASVDTNGIVTADKQGTAIITATTVDGNFEAYCQISVASVPAIELIYPTQGVYDTAQEVVINVSNLVEDRVKTPTEWHYWYKKLCYTIRVY